MTRAIDASLATALAQDSHILVHLLEINTSSGTSYLTDAYKDLDWNGHTWVAFGHFLGFDSIDETLELLVNDATISLSSIDQTYLALFLADKYTNYQASIWLTALSTTDYTIIGTPQKMLTGRIDDPRAVEDPDSGTATVAARLINQWGDAERVNGTRTNQQQQDTLFPGDKGFEHAHKVSEPIIWGRGVSDGRRVVGGSGGGRRLR